jgi:hypothetical protein
MNEARRNHHQMMAFSFARKQSTAVRNPNKNFFKFSTPNTNVLVIPKTVRAATQRVTLQARMSFSLVPKT